MKHDEKGKALRLREEGKSYKEILESIKVSKSTLSNWLGGIILNDVQKSKLLIKEKDNQLGFGDRIKIKWCEKRKQVKDGYSPPLNDPAYMLGLGLYWGEGAKASPSAVSMGNTSHQILVNFMKWIKRYFVGDFDGFKVAVQHHYDANRDAEVNDWWSKQLDVPVVDFCKAVHILPRTEKMPRRFGYGIATVRAAGKGVWKIRQKIQKSIESIS